MLIDTRLNIKNFPYGCATAAVYNLMIIKNKYEAKQSGILEKIKDSLKEQNNITMVKNLVVCLKKYNFQGEYEIIDSVKSLKLMMNYHQTIILLYYEKKDLTDSVGHYTVLHKKNGFIYDCNKICLDSDLKRMISCQNEQCRPLVWYF